MATIKKTITGLKPATNYLFSLKPKNTEISAIDAIPDTIRVQTPGVVSSPSSITGVLLAANFKSAMLRFNHASMVDLDYYEYKIYLANDVTETALKARASTTTDGAMVSGITKSNLVVISDLDNTTLTGASPTPVSYKAKVRAVNTAGNAGDFSSASASATTQLIESQFIQDLTAAKITAGTIGAHEIVLTQSGTQTTITPPATTAIIRSSDYNGSYNPTTGVWTQGTSGWIIRGDGTAEFGSAAIRGSLAARSLWLNAYNRWGRNAADTADESSVLLVGNETNQLYWNPTGGTPVGGTPTSLLKVGNSTNYMQWDNNTLTVTGAITTNATIESSTAGGLTIGTNSIQFGSGGYGSSIFFAGLNAGANKFSIGSKLLYDGTTLAIDGTVTIGSIAASTVVSNAATGASDPATRINTGSTTIAGGKIRTGLIESSNFDWPNTATTYSSAGTRIDLDNGQIVSKGFRIDTSGNASFLGSITSGTTINGATITGGTININSNLFRVDTSGNVFGNNIYATGSVSDLGLQIRADGTGGSTSGQIWILSASGKETKIGNLDGALNVRYRAAVGTIPEAVVLEPAKYLTSSGSWSQKRHLEINLADDTGTDTTQYNMYINSDLVMRGSALTGTGNDIWFDDATTSGTGGVARFWEPSPNKGKYVLARDSSSLKYKENVLNISSQESINILKKVNVVKYTFKKNMKYDTDFSYQVKQLDYHYGLIAEEVAKDAPELSQYGFTDEGRKHSADELMTLEDLNNELYFEPVNWRKDEATALLISSFQNLIERVESLEAQLAG